MDHFQIRQVVIKACAIRKIAVWCANLTLIAERSS